MNARRLLWVGLGDPTLPRTGGDKYSTKVISYLQAKGWEIVIPPVLTTARGGILKRELSNSVRLVRILMPLIGRRELVLEDIYWHRWLIFFNVLARLLKSIRIVVICHHPTYRNFGSRRLAGLVKLTEKIFLHTVDHVITVSRSTQQEVIALGVSARNVSLVPDGFDRPPQPDGQCRWDSPVRLLFVGTCYARKGIEYLLHAMRHLKGRAVVLDLVGDLTDDVRYARRMQALATEQGLVETVIFHGRVSEKRLWQLYATADIFVLPSLWEGFGIVLLEAMAFGLPIVTTHVGAIPELVVHEENGLLVPPADSEALSGALVRLVADAGLRGRLGEKGRVRCQQSLTWEEVGHRFTTVLDELEDTA